jgi:hypothetical protein
MSKPFASKRSAWWLGGILVLVLGFLAAAVLLPATAPAPGSGQPDVRVPRMENVPPPNAPKLQLEVEKDEKAP